MTHNPLRAVMQRLPWVVPMHGADLCDADLLERYVAHRDELAFAELVRRYGAMVLATCRRILGNDHDAEDAFQATFLVLVRKATTIRPRAMLGNWLYGVAYNTALKANAMRRKRRAREREAGATPRPAGSDQPSSEVHALDEELNRLPQRYRVPIVLCELQGKTHKEVARQLGCPEGTVASRLSRGRRLLAERLSRRGLSAGVVTAALSEAGAGYLPAALLNSTVRGATLFAAEQGAKDLLSPTAIALTEGMLKSMLLSKLKVTAVVALLGLVVAVLLLLPTVSRPVHSAAPPAIGTARTSATVASAEPVEFKSPVNLLGSDEVFSVAISPDGTLAAAALGNPDRPGRVELWDLRSRKRLWAEHEARGVSSVAFAHDGKRLAWSSFGGLTRVEQLAPRRTLFQVRLVGNHRVACSGDGKWLALAGEEDGSVRLLDAKTGKQTAILPSELAACFCVAFSRDSKLLAVGGGSFGSGGPGKGANQVNLFDVTTRKLVGKLSGHMAAVIGVAFAPRDELIATSGVDAGVRLYDGKTYQLKTQLRGHSAAVKGLAFSPSADGLLLATASFDRTVRLWDAPAGKQLAHLGDHPNVARELAFSPDGRLLVSGGARSSLKLWDVKERKLAATLSESLPPVSTSAAVTLAVSPDDRLLVSGHEKGEITWRDAHTGAVRQMLNGHDDAVTALVFSGDGKLLATSSPDMVVKVWDAQTYQLRHVLKGHTSWVYSLAFSSDSKTLASGSYDRTVRLWGPVKGEALATLQGHKASVRALAFSADGRLLASGSGDKKVRLWNVKSRTSEAVLQGADDTIRALSFSADDKILAAVSELAGLYAWDVDKAKLLPNPPGYKEEVTALAFSWTGRHVVTSTGRGALALRDAATGKVRHQWSAGNVAVRALSFGSGGRQLFALGEDGSLNLWSSVPGPLRFFDGHTGPVRGAVFSSEGKYLLSWSGYPQDDRTLRLWDVKTARQVRLLMTGKERLNSATFSPDVKHAAAGESTGVIHLLEVETGKQVHQLKGHKGEIASVRFSSDGRWLLSAGFDRTVRLWDAQTGAEVRIFKGHTDGVLCAIFHGDGKRILSGGADGTVRIWDRQGRQLKSINHKTRIENLVLLPDGKRFLSSSIVSGVQLWDLEQDKLIRSFRHVHGASWVATTKDGRRALSASHDGRARLWDVETAEELHAFGIHRGWVRCVDVSPDGSTFITGSGGVSDQLAGDDCTIRLWKMPPEPAAQHP
jgi:RNA polymerase sigma factor (sigma-70 family)